MPQPSVPQPARPSNPEAAVKNRVILSFDVEEHHRIEAAVALQVGEDLKARYASRLDDSTRWLLDQLACHGLRATFFVVGQTARDNAALVRAIHDRGHELASHSWDHRRIHRLTPAEFREDLRRCKDVLEQATGQGVYGYRAPTFSIDGETAWAIDVLAEEGFRYDSSIFPVHHDRYGVPRAPRTAFLARGQKHALLEFPPATGRCLGLNIPAGGGGYFRLFPLWLTDWAVRQCLAQGVASSVMLYFHPWEFDPDQPRLPLSALGRWRTYVGLRRTRGHLLRLLQYYGSCRAIDVAKGLDARNNALPSYCLAGRGTVDTPCAAGGGLALSSALQRLE
jgi:polysaccharide deacetylase family protein (PEP-CTERM system associated)